MNRILRACMRQTMRKRMDESKLNIRVIELQKCEISCFNLSTNPIYSFVFDETLHYFRECVPLQNRTAYFERETGRFFDALQRLERTDVNFKQDILIKVRFSGETQAAFREYTECLLKNGGFVQKIANADVISEKLGFSIWEPKQYDTRFFAEFGLESLPDDCMEIAVYYLWCMRGAASAFRTRRICCGKRYAFFHAGKSIASKIVADALGLGHLITSAELCKLVFEDGNTVLGVISERAPGDRMADLRVSPCGELQKDLMSLSLLDMICLQTDHGPNNYNVAVMGENCHVCAFDNDNPNTFLPLPYAAYRLLGCSSLLSSAGVINRPFVSRDAYDGICNVRLDRLKRDLRPYLNAVQIGALIVRIRQIQKALKKTAAQKPDFVLEDAQWNDWTVEKELSGHYGKTYLTIASERKPI